MVSHTFIAVEGGGGGKSYIDGSGDTVDYTSSPALMDTVCSRLHYRRIVINIFHTYVDDHRAGLSSSICSFNLNNTQYSWTYMVCMIKLVTMRTKVLFTSLS